MNFAVYPQDQLKDCWVVWVSEGCVGNFRGSRLIGVFKETGTVVYDGLVGDEG